MRAHVVTDTDVDLLRAVGRQGSVVGASRTLGITRDRANYRIAQLERAFGGAVVASERGGRVHGDTRLTALGDRIVRQGFDSFEISDTRPSAPPLRSNLLRGTYRAGACPEVVLRSGVRLRVAFTARDGEPISLLLDPESILVARGRFPSSARNVLRATVVGVDRGRAPFEANLLARAGTDRLRIAVTGDSARRLELAKGRTVWLYVKATALRRIGRDRSVRGSAGPSPRGSSAAARPNARRSVS